METTVLYSKRIPNQRLGIKLFRGRRKQEEEERTGWRPQCSIQNEYPTKGGFGKIAPDLKTYPRAILSLGLMMLRLGF